MTDLLQMAMELVEIPSPSRAETELASHVERVLSVERALETERVADNVIARSRYGRSRRIVIAGHLDTVPPFDDLGARLEGDVLWGLGAVDMKGGLAVMLSLLPVIERASVDVTMVFYTCEEIERSANGLGHLSRERPELLAGQAAVLVEPTGGLIEAGCQGTMRLGVTMAGRRAHTARPQMGINAVHRLGALLRVVEGYETRNVVLDGCTYSEQLQAVAVSAGVAPNVVPDVATVTLNHRFAPDRDPLEAEESLRGIIAPLLDESLGDHLEVIDVAPGAPPALGDELLSRLAQIAGEAPRAKLGWTDVATFAEIGIPATNFGPGDPLLAHTADENVSRTELSHAKDVLERFLTEAP